MQNRSFTSRVEFLVALRRAVGYSWEIGGSAMQDAIARVETMDGTLKERYDFVVNDDLARATDTICTLVAKRMGVAVPNSI